MAGRNRVVSDTEKSLKKNVEKCVDIKPKDIEVRSTSLIVVLDKNELFWVGDAIKRVDKYVAGVRISIDRVLTKHCKTRVIFNLEREDSKGDKN